MKAYQVLTRNTETGQVEEEVTGAINDIDLPLFAILPTPIDALGYVQIERGNYADHMELIVREVEITATDNLTITAACNGTMKTFEE